MVKPKCSCLSGQDERAQPPGVALEVGTEVGYLTRRQLYIVLFLASVLIFGILMEQLLCPTLLGCRVQQGEATGRTR